ncbi:peptidylprolyl isomerase [Brevundimonas kwangchunensis]|uniref:Parvulin-like PPIase n=1 Tax=Brevundimonas kwangchunensis TaxID=322163 RepID=A0ABN1H4D0_9CAUL
MLTAFRKFAKSKWAIGLLGLLAVGLLVTGGTQMDVLGSLGPKHVISAGDRSVNGPEFRADMERIREGAQQQAGRSLSFEELIGDGGLVQYLRQRSEQLGFMDWAWKAGIRPGKELVLRQIRQAPGFFDQVTGRFSQTQYETTLAQNNATPELFERQLRDDIITRHYGSALGAGLRLPNVYGAVFANQALETRNARWFSVTQAMAGTAPAPTDAQLTTFMQQNAAQLRLPEFRSASVVLFDAPADAQAAITEARIEERFNFRRDALSQPERRTFVTLTASTKAAADRIADALRAGQTAQAVGSANNIQPATYDSTPRSAVSDAAIGNAVFAMQPNTVSEPIQAQVGFVVAQLSAVVPGRPATLADVRDQVIQELRSEDVRAAVYRRVEAYEKARAEGKDLNAAVTQAGGRIINVPAVTQDGRTQQGGQVNLPPQLLQSMWALTRGAESEVVDAGQGQYFVVRLDNVIAPALPSLSDPAIRTALARNWVARENVRLLTTRTDALAARLRRGDDIAAVAASVGATVQTAANLTRQDQSHGQGVTAGVFTSGRNEVFSQQNTENSFVLGRTDSINAPSATLAAPVAEQFRERMTPDTIGALGQSAIQTAATRSKATYDEAQARLALGLAATATPAAPGASGGAAPAAPAPAQ